MLPFLFPRLGGSSEQKYLNPSVDGVNPTSLLCAEILPVQPYHLPSPCPAVLTTVLHYDTEVCGARTHSDDLFSQCLS